jgi:LPS-assembly protein
MRINTLSGQAKPKPKQRVSPVIGLWAAGALCMPLAAGAQSPSSGTDQPGATLQASPNLAPLPRDKAGKAGSGTAALPIILRAKSLRSQLDLQAVAEGDVELRSGGLVIRADQLTYDSTSDLATAKGQVRISRNGARYSGPELQMGVQRFEGFFLQPEFEFLQLGAGGRADRIDFFGPSRASASNASYTSCPRDDPGTEPAWLLKTQRVSFDLDRNEGIAEGAQLRFLGTTILALPTMSFPLTDARKSGWLPPTVGLDNRSGLELSVPYYWDIAPNRDATLAPRLITRRGLGLDGEFRYLEPNFEGSLTLAWLPFDSITKNSRDSLQWLHSGRIFGDVNYSAEVLRASDDDWWKDFPHANRSFTARLLPTRFALNRPFVFDSARGLAGEGIAYVRWLQWQVLQAQNSFITAPYERSPQVGVRLNARYGGLELAAESEFNRFALPANQERSTQRQAGDRVHLLGSVSYPWRQPGWWLVPRLSVNAAGYNRVSEGVPLAPLQGNNLSNSFTNGRRLIPSASLDAGLEFERTTTLFGRTLAQTLEPRFFYVNTPYRQQNQLPNYDSAAKDFNFVSIYSDNAFSGVDRVSDAHQVTAGVTSRLVDSSTGAEALRLGLVQRYLLRSQRITARADGTPDGEPLTQRFSDALLLGSTSVFPGWQLDAAVQYSPDINRSVRSILGARYSPGPYRTVGATYRLARGLSEQLEVGWQWPVWGAGPTAGAASEGLRSLAQNINSNAPKTASGQRGECSGSWYSVGRFNYSLKDRRLTDSVLGLEYDAGCWIGRFVVEQLSTGRSEATKRYLFQLELVGLSRLGSNPLKVLKDNIPGYRLLREERGGTFASPSDQPTVSPFYD